MNPVILLVLHSTLTKSMMGVTVIAKLTKQFFSPGALPLSSLGSILLFSPVWCYLALYSSCLFLTLTSTAASGWLFSQCCCLNIISSWAETQHVTIFQGWTMKGACRPRCCQSPGSTFIWVVVSFCSIPSLRLGNTPLYFYKSASRTEYIWSRKFFTSSHHHLMKWRLLLCFTGFLKRIQLLPTFHLLTTTRTFTSTLSPTIPFYTLFCIPLLYRLHLQTLIFGSFIYHPKEKIRFSYGTLGKDVTKVGIMSYLGHMFAQKKSFS